MPEKQQIRSLNVLLVASECFPLIKTGGLADVVGALPLALGTRGVDATVFLPGFPAVLQGMGTTKRIAKLNAASLPSGLSGQILSGSLPSGLKILALDIPNYFNIEGNPYLDADGTDRAHNGEKFACFAKVAADIAMGKYAGHSFDVLHAHDWQAGLAAAYIRAADSTAVKTVLTIHNLAFQGVFPGEMMSQLSLPQSYFSETGLEYWKKVSYLKAGIVYSDHITTVSPTYALEIQSDEGGMGFGGLLRNYSNKLTGILNGIDTEVWNPAGDPAIAKNYSAKALSGKAKCKSNLQKSLGLSVSKKKPLFCVVSRLTTQKGLDLLAGMVDYIADRGGQLALLGTGDSAIEFQFEKAAKRHPKNVSVHIGYDEAYAHQLQAASDAIIVPSRFEPCGLTQLCALRYGTVPVVGRVGGLNDTIIDANPAALANGAATGFQFSPITAHMLYSAIERAFLAFENKDVWTEIVKNGLSQNVGWDASAAAYTRLYQDLTG